MQADEYTPETRPWRTIVRITAVNGDKLKVILPAWSAIDEVEVDRNVFPKGIKMYFGKRFHCMVNIGANKAEDLKFMPPYEHK